MPTITLNNFNDASNEQIYTFLTQRLHSSPAETRIYGHLVMDPEENERVIASRLELCRAYCQDPERIALEYARYKDAGFDPENYEQLAFMVSNLDVLDILHRHSLPFAEPNIPQIVAIYEQELREQYRDRMVEAVIEALIIDIPQDQKDQSDLIIMREAIRELDQCLAHYFELLKALDVNDAAIREYFGLDRKAKSSKAMLNIATTDNPYMLRRELEKRYIAVAMAQDQKFMKFLYSQYESQQGLLARADQRTKFPAIPDNAVDGLALTAHLHQFNSKLYNRDLKIHIDPKDANKQVVAIIEERNELMKQAKRSAAKKLPKNMRYIFNDAKERTNEDLEYIANYLGITIQATHELLDAANEKLTGTFDEYQKSLDTIETELSAILDDARDIYNEESKAAAGYKLVGLIWNLSHLIGDIKQSIQDNAIAAVKKIAFALDKVINYIEPLQNAVAKIIPDSVKKAAQGPGLKTSQTREARQKGSKPT